MKWYYRPFLSTVIFLCLVQMTWGSERENLIAMYFSLGYSYNLIVCFLFFIHGISISLRQLKRILRQLGLRRRHPPMDRNLYNLTVTLIRVSLIVVRWALFGGYTNNNGS